MATHIPISFRLPFKVIADHLVTRDPFRAGSQHIVALDDESFSKLETALAEYSGFLDLQTVHTIASEVLGTDQGLDELSSMVWNVARLIRQSDEEITDAADALKSAIEEQEDELEAAERTILADRLQKLVAVPRGFDLQHKAETLVGATGRQLDDVQIVCDIRPVFNRDRTGIEGAIPIATLRLDIDEVDGSQSRAEVRLTEAQIVDLQGKAEAAVGKVLLLKKFLAEKGVVMPRTRSTSENGEQK